MERCNLMKTSAARGRHRRAVSQQKGEISPSVGGKWIKQLTQQTWRRKSLGGIGSSINTISLSLSKAQEEGKNHQSPFLNNTLSIFVTALLHTSTEESVGGAGSFGVNLRKRTEGLVSKGKKKVQQADRSQHIDGAMDWERAWRPPCEKSLV